MATALIKKTINLIPPGLKAWYPQDVIEGEIYENSEEPGWQQWLAICSFLSTSRWTEAQSSLCCIGTLRVQLTYYRQLLQS